MGLSFTYPGGRKKALSISFDGGTVQDDRLVEILDKYGIKSTFNLNSGLMAKDDRDGNINGRLTLKQARKLFLNSQHEVACHGYTHNRMDSLPYVYGVREAVKDRETLEDILERPIRGLAYPYGRFSDKLIENLRTIGIVYGRTEATTNEFHLPFSADDWMRFNPTCRCNNASMVACGEALIKSSEKEYPLLLSIWGQTSDLDWEAISNFCRSMGGREEIWYATNIEIYDYFDAYNHLVYSAASTRIYNPSAIAVWISANGNIHEVKPGQTMEV